LNRQPHPLSNKISTDHLAEPQNLDRKPLTAVTQSPTWAVTAILVLGVVLVAALALWHWNGGRSGSQQAIATGREATAYIKDKAKGPGGRAAPSETASCRS